MYCIRGENKSVEDKNIDMCALGGAEAAILELSNDGSDQRFANGFKTTSEIAELLGNFFLERDVLFAQNMFPLLPNYSFVNPTVHEIEQ